MTIVAIRRPSAAPATATRGSNAGLLVLSLVLGLAGWSFLAWWFGPTAVASPLMTLQAFLELSASGRLLEDALISTQRILLGWGLGVLVGAPLGIVMGRFNVVRQLLDPYVEFFRFIPPTAFVTLAVIWFGIGETSKVFLIFYTAVFIVTVSTVAAVVSIPQNRLHAAENLGASKLQIMRTVILPSAVPGLLTGARIAMGNSFLTIVAAEIVAAESGLGALIWQARNYGRIDWTFVAIILMGVLGYLFDRVLRMASRRWLARYGAKS